MFDAGMGKIRIGQYENSSGADKLGLGGTEA